MMLPILMYKFMKKYLLLSIPALMLLFYILCLNHISFNDFGVSYNSISGELKIQERAGWYITSPFTQVSTFPKNAFIVSLNMNNNSTVINSKVIRLRPENFIDFIKREGFHYAYGNDFKYFMNNYAYSSTNWSFIEVLQETR